MPETKQTATEKRAARSAAAKKGAETRRRNREASHGGDLNASADRALAALRDLGKAVRVEVEDRIPPILVSSLIGLAVVVILGLIIKR